MMSNLRVKLFSTLPMHFKGLLRSHSCDRRSICFNGEVRQLFSGRRHGVTYVTRRLIGDTRFSTTRASSSSLHHAYASKLSQKYCRNTALLLHRQLIPEPRTGLISLFSLLRMQKAMWTIKEPYHRSYKLSSKCRDEIAHRPKCLEGDPEDVPRPLI